MDQGASQIRDEIKTDVSEILRTRLAMAEKLERLEERLQDTMTETKSAVLDVVDSVRDTAEDFVDRTKRTFNPMYQVQQHPWMMIGAAIVGGFLLARMGEQSARNGSRNGTRQAGEYPGTPAEVRQQGHRGPFTSRMSDWQRELTDELMDQVQGEVVHVKEALIVAAQTFLRDMARQALRMVTEPLERAAAGGPRNRNGGNESSRFERDGIRHR